MVLTSQYYALRNGGSDMTKKMQIGLLSPFFKPISGYEEAADDLDIDLVIVTARRIDWKNKEVYGLVYNGEAWVEETVSLPPALYNRYYGSKPKVVARLETVIGKNKVFNHITRFDKWGIHTLLAKSPLKAHLPATALYTSQHLLNYLERFQRVILKPVAGQLGTKIYLVVQEGGVFYLHHGTKSPVIHFLSREDLLAHVEGLINKDFIIQQYIALATIQGRVFDLRCLVQKDASGSWAVTGILSRIALQYSYITNLSQTIVPPEHSLRQAFPNNDFLPQLTELSIQAGRVVEASLGSLGELSVDFGLDQQGNVWIIELNAKPMKSIFGALGNSELIRAIYLQPLLYAHYLANLTTR